MTATALPLVEPVPRKAFVFRQHSVLPGFSLALGYSVIYLALIVLIPLAAVFLKSASLGWEGFWHVTTQPRVLASFKLSFGASLIAAGINVVFGLIFAWVLVRYRFPGKRLIDALIDLPFALPTAVAGIALATLYAKNGWIGSLLEPLGIEVAYTPLGVLVALVFIGLPFVVRTVQPVLEDLEAEVEEAAACLGANRWQTFWRGDRALPHAGAAHRLCPVLRPCRRRIRIGHLHRRQHADGLRDHAADDHHQAGAVRLRRRHGHRRGHARRLLHSVAADQCAAGVDPAQSPKELIMAGTVAHSWFSTPDASRRHSATSEPFWVRALLIALALAFFGLFLLMPLAAVFAEAFRKGWSAYVAGVVHADALSAIKLTLMVAAIAVPLNLIFGVAAAWAIAKFEFRGKQFLISLIDLPFSVSPVVSGLIYVLLFGAQGWFGPLLADADVKILFAVPGIVLATVFVTFPFVARELIPQMQAQGSDEEEAAVVLGASGWTIFYKVTLPNIKWGLLYGVILCNARAMGEFGAVSVVSGHIRGKTNTMPLQVEILYNEYNFVAAFAVASLLALLALLTLGIKGFIEWRIGQSGNGGFAATGRSGE